jgi:ATP-dependent Clp protease ATP-binding subunit ClpB
LDELKRHFKPKFLNRIDDTVVFTPLTLSVVKQIIDKIVAQLTERLSHQDINLELTTDALDWIAKNVYEPEYGARPIKRFMTKHLETPLAKALVSGKVLPNSVVLVGLKDDTLVFDMK